MGDSVDSDAIDRSPVNDRIREMPQMQNAQPFGNGRADFRVLDKALARMLNVKNKRLGNPYRRVFRVVIDGAVELGLRGY